MSSHIAPAGKRHFTSYRMLREHRVKMIFQAAPSHATKASLVVIPAHKCATLAIVVRAYAQSPSAVDVEGHRTLPCAIKGEMSHLNACVFVALRSTVVDTCATNTAVQGNKRPVSDKRAGRRADLLVPHHARRQRATKLSTSALGSAAGHSNVATTLAKSSVTKVLVAPAGRLSSTKSLVIASALYCNRHCRVVPSHPLVAMHANGQRAVAIRKSLTTVTQMKTLAPNVHFSHPRCACAARRH